MLTASGDARRSDTILRRIVGAVKLIKITSAPSFYEPDSKEQGQKSRSLRMIISNRSDQFVIAILCEMSIRGGPETALANACDARPSA